MSVSLWSCRVYCCCIALCCNVSCCVVLYCILLFCVVLHCVSLGIDTGIGLCIDIGVRLVMASVWYCMALRLCCFALCHIGSRCVVPYCFALCSVVFCGIVLAFVLV